MPCRLLASLQAAILAPPQAELAQVKLQEKAACAADILERVSIRQLHYAFKPVEAKWP